MTKPVVQQSLNDLRSVLMRLQLKKLPPDTHPLFREAMQQLDHLEAHISQDAEHNRLEVLYRVSRMLGASLDLDEVLARVMDAVIELTQAERGFLMLVDPETGKLDLRAARNLEKETLESRDMDVSRTVLRNVFETGQGIVTTDAQQDPRFASQESVILYALRSVMCAPLRVRDRISGVVYLDNRAQAGLFSEQDLELLTAFASQAAIAIDNARQYTHTRQDKTRFVSAVTHELRAPMTSIKGYADLLRQGMVGPLNEMQGNFLEVIRNNVERMSVLVSDLSDLSHIETGRMQLSLSAVRVNECVHQVLQALHARIDEKHQILAVDLPDDLVAVYADPARLVQVITILVQNATQYTDTDGQIDLRASQEGDFVRVEVADTGIGITPEDQKGLFTQFFRSEDAPVREQQGWGLGLNLAKRLVELMGGQIGAQSEFRKGSLFWFTLPVVKL